MRAIERIAAFCREHEKQASGLRLEFCRSLGMTGTLKEARPLIDAEITRQNAVAIARRKAREVAPTKTFAQLLSELRDFKARRFTAMPASYLELHDQKAPQSIYRVGSLLVTLLRTVESDYDRYSKGWHRRYGPSQTVKSSFRAEWIDPRTKRVRKVEAATDHHRNGLRSACLALVRFRDRLPAGLVPAPATDKLSLRVQPIVELRPIGQPNKRLKLYERTLLGDSLGFVATYRGENYHESTAEWAIEGVREKAVAARNAKRLVTVGKAFGLTGTVRQSLHALGFCDPGINDAFATLGFCAEDATPEALAGVTVAQLRDVARKWRRELSTVAAIVCGNAQLLNLVPRDCADFLKGLL